MSNFSAVFRAMLKLHDHFLNTPQQRKWDVTKIVKHNREAIDDFANVVADPAICARIVAILATEASRNKILFSYEQTVYATDIQCVIHNDYCLVMLPDESGTILRLSCENFNFDRVSKVEQVTAGKEDTLWDAVEIVKVLRP